MNLKESYRYANFLENLLSTAQSYLIRDDFVTTTKEDHLRSKANKDAEDELGVIVDKQTDVDFTPNQVIDFIVKVISEKEKLFAAIANAKSTTEINIDNAISINKKKQNIISVFQMLANRKSRETQTTGRDYKFDINGEQKPYSYNIKRVTSIDYDRDSVKNLIKKYRKECDAVSTKLDEIEINTQVSHDCLFDINDSFEDLVVG
mgnify:CR=1 FL=1